MYIILSLVGSSIDGFLCGFLIKNLGVKFTQKQWVNMFFIIFSCCFTAAFCGRILSYTSLERYIDLVGFLLMLFLSLSAINSIYKNEEIKQGISVTVLAISVAADASVVCMYLGLSGANILIISLISALLHCVLMAAGSTLGEKITKQTVHKKARILAAMVFFSITIIKFVDIIK